MARHGYQRQKIMLTIVIAAILITALYNHNYSQFKSHAPLFKTYQQDPRILGNFTNFKFLMDSATCESNDQVNMLMLVGSHPSHITIRNLLRKAIEQTPTLQSNIYKIVFAFGLLQNENDQQQLENESKKYGDIVQGNFIDAYHNVTLRDLMALRWAWQRCSQAKYITRFDDDIAVDIFEVNNELDKCCATKPVFIGCVVVWRNASVSRQGRYSVSPFEHPNDVYDDYCNGWMYTMTPLMAFMLDWASYHVQYYWMNDAYITGSLVKYLGIMHTLLKIDYTDNTQFMMNVKNQSKIFTKDLLVLIPT